VDTRIKALEAAFPWFKGMDEARKGVLVNMSFQMGVEGLKAFKNTLASVANGLYEKAAAQMLESLWASQTPERAKRLSEQMLTGEWQ
jgi:lysozyme